MNLRKLSLGLLISAFVIAPAIAGEDADTTMIMRDYTLNNGVGSTGPGMSGYLHQGMQDRTVRMTSIRNGKGGHYRAIDSFSIRPVYNNDVSLSLQHIR